MEPELHFLADGGQTAGSVLDRLVAFNDAARSTPPKRVA